MIIGASRAVAIIGAPTLCVFVCVFKLIPLPPSLPPVDPPQITQQPANKENVDPGSTVTFTVTATTGAGSLTYQWQLNSTDLDPPPAGVSGATTHTLTITNVQESNEGMYRCVVTNAAGSTTSNAAQLTVREWLCMYMTYELHCSFSHM